MKIADAIDRFTETLDEIESSELLTPKQTAKVLHLSVTTLCVYRAKRTMGADVGPEFITLSSKVIRYAKPAIMEYYEKLLRGKQGKGKVTLVA